MNETKLYTIIQNLLRLESRFREVEAFDHSKESTKLLSNILRDEYTLLQKAFFSETGISWKKACLIHTTYLEAERAN